MVVGILSKLNNMAIRVKLVVLFSGLILAIAVFIYIYFPAKYEALVENSLLDKANSIALAAAHSAAPAIIFEDTKTLGEVVEGARQNGDLVYVVIMDAKGRILKSYNQQVAESVGYRNLINSDPGRQKIVKVGAPAYQEEIECGKLFLGMSTTEIQSTIAASRQNFAIISFLILAVGITLVFVIAKIITAPLQAMLQTFQKIAEGDLTQRSVVKYNDEVGKLSSAFNRMVGNLEKAYSDLDYLNKNLELKVDDRTNELKAEIREKLKSEQKLRESEQRLRKNVERGNILLQLYNDAPQFTDKQLFDYVLLQAVHLTDSLIGFLYQLTDDQQTVILTSKTDETHNGTQEEMTTHYLLKETGEWMDCVRSRGAIQFNSFTQTSAHKGLPIGRHPLVRMLCVPIIEDDKVVMVIVVGNKILDYEDQDVLQVQLVANEVLKIQKQRLLDRLLKESEKKYKKIFDNVQDIFYQIDNNGVILEISPSVEKYSGYKREELIGMPIHKLYANPDDRGKFLAALADRKEVTDYTLKLRSKDGTFVYSSINAHLLADDDGNIIGVDGALRDITERRLAEEETELNKERFRELFDEAPIGYYEIDHAGRILNVNKTVSEMLGYSSELLIGQFAWVLSEDQIKSRQEIEAELRGDGLLRQNYEKNLVRTDGTFLPALCEDKILRDKSGAIAGIRTAFQDITKRKRVENELLLAKEKAEEVSRLKSSFLANMSHELRTPMIGILGYSEILDAKSNDPRIREIAQVINMSGQRLMNTLNLILDLSRIEAGKLDLNITNVDIMGIIREVCGLFEETARKNGLTLAISSGFESLRLSLDESIFREIMVNLINNGIKYTEQGGVTVAVTTEEVDSAGWAVIKVQDSGIGIAPKDMDLIWDEFRQVSEGIGRGFEGTGLGLTITKKFVEKLKGEIFVESQLGVGSVFTIRLPGIIKEITEEVKVQEPDRHAETIPVQLHTGILPDVLYVEDDPIAFDLLERHLAGICKLENVVKASDALKKVREKQYTAILMDINLGRGMDGLETTRLIRKIASYENTPVIAITAYAMMGDKEEFLEAGCTHYISKPYDKKEVISLVSRVLYPTQA